FMQDGCEDDNPAVNITLTEAQIDAVVLQEMARQNMVGIVVGVVQNGEIIHTKAYGHDDLLRSQPLTTGSVFNWASISKTLTAVAAFKAIQENKMALTDEVYQYVDGWSGTGNKGNITIEHLLTHRSGIVHYGRDEDGNTICNPNYAAYTSNNAWNATQSVNVFKNCDLGSAPNTEYNYTTFGYNLLGAAIEGAVGQAYEAYVDDVVADVAGMSSLSAFFDGRGGFDMDCNRILVPDTEGRTEYKLPGGGWSSNILDLTRFMKGLINNQFITSLSLWIKAIPGNESTGYRYGVFTSTWDDEFYVNHGGDNDEVEAYMGFFPSHGNGVCYMINGDSYPEKDQLAKRIFNLMGYSLSINNKPVDECGSTDDCGDRMAAVWRDNGQANNIVLRRGLTTDEFNKEWNFLLDAGYYLADMETYVSNFVRKWDGIFKKGTMRSALWRGWSTDDFRDKWEEMADQGLRLIDLETYTVNGERKWAGAFIESNEPYAMWRNFTSSAFSDKHFEMAEQGYKLIDVETYVDGTTRKWAGIWLGSGSNLLNRNYSEADFKDLQQTRESNDYRLIDIETYTIGSYRKWAGVWEATPQDEHFRTDKKMCDLINNYHDGFKADGKELLDLERY
ncbi:MAG: serine hydrolase, partial [Phaeodactylibacter sp.]|nr:serine hydrolase [Phaeodactylibacter sp.]